MTKNSLLVLLLLTGCGGDDGPEPTTTTTTISECIPSDEICNGLDDDCDGLLDNNATDGFTFYEDLDVDGFGNPESIAVSCEDALDGYILDENTDCDDTAATTYPGADEYCDGADNDCDNETDEDDAVDIATWYADNDKDGFGDEADSTDSCYAPKGWVADSTDCDDIVGNTYPGADEYCDGIDTDCDGIFDNDDAIGAPTWYADTDGDNFGDDATSAVACYESKGWISDNTDCNDTDASTYPDAPEYCDGIDSDCNSVLDDDYAMDTNNYYADIDSDGFGDEDNSYDACSLPAGYVEDNTDCDDNASMTYPGAPESCDGIDTDCNWVLDDDYSLDALTWYADFDNDTYGDATNSTPSCSQPAGWVADASDCDDSSDAVSPVADEWCNGVDNDCNGTIDDDYASDSVMWFADTDGDNYGDSTNTTRACYEAVGWLSNSTDCDDSTDTVHPGADEYCDSVDTNCNGVFDDDYAVDANTYFADGDEDGYGNVDMTQNSCSLPSGYVEDYTDCNDGNDLTYPGAAEVCDVQDNNCDGDIDEGVQNTYYSDADNDGYGNTLDWEMACSAPAGYVVDDTDCDDGNNITYPGAAEVCDVQDNDCDGDTDEGVQNTYYSDADNDGYGNTLDWEMACSAPFGYVANDDDCNDEEPEAWTGRAELCNDWIDNDCDGGIDNGSDNTYYLDGDGDLYGDPAITVLACEPPANYVDDNTDCDDSSASVNPKADEYCNSIDEDCNGNFADDYAVDALDWYDDYDGDTYGDATDYHRSCTAPSGHVSDDTDCDDNNNNAYPGAQEWCTGVDNDCNGTIDDDYANDTNRYYADDDGDGYGAISSGFTDACSVPSGYAITSSDCDDDRAYTNPGAFEFCNGIDDDCDGAELTSGVGLHHSSGTAWWDGSSYFSTTAGVQSSGYSYDGDWYFCGDTTYYVNWNTTSPMSIIGINGTPTLDGGNVDTVINNDAGETLLLTNMIIKNGYTSGSGAAIYQYGGFLDLVDVDLKYNDSGSNGGGIHISNSGTLYGDNVNFSFNTSGGHGGGLYASGNATVDLQDSYFYLNYADSKGGGIRGYDLASLNLIDTEFFYNFSDADYDDVGGGGAIALYATTLNASDSGTGTYNCEFYYNIDSALNSDAAVLLDKSTANFTDCDFTDDTNAYDNYKYDIATAGSGYRYEYPSNTTVSCDEYECGSAVSDYTGLSYADFTSSSTSSTYLVGHIIQSEGTRTIDYFELWMGTGTDCSPTYYVYESSDKSSWSEIWSGVGDLITYATHNSSGDVGVPTKDGYYYALVGHYDMSVCAELTYTYSAISQPTDVSFGTFTDYIFDAGWAPGDIIIGNGTGYSFWGRVRSSH